MKLNPGRLPDVFCQDHSNGRHGEEVATQVKPLSGNNFINNALAAFAQISSEQKKNRSLKLKAHVS